MSLPIAAPLSESPVNLSSEFSYYHALGDSITAGFTLPMPTTQRYAALVSSAVSLTLTDNAIGGDQACDLPADQIVQKNELPTLAARGLYTLLVSTNDVSFKGAGSYESIFNLCQQATIAWIAVPVEYKVLATDPTVKVAGPAHLESFWNALTTDARNASVTFTVKTAASEPVYVWYRITDGNKGSFSYAVDGSQVGLLATGPSPAITTIHGTESSLAFLRIPAVSAGSHTVTFTQTSTGSDGLGVVAVGTPPPSGTLNLPRLFVGTTPKQNSQSNAVCAGNDAFCQAYIQDIRSNVAVFASDGLGVSLFDTRKYEIGTDADMSDSVHPNSMGHREIALALYEAISE